jgi:hypothetical protein
MLRIDDIPSAMDDIPRTRMIYICEANDDIQCFALMIYIDDMRARANDLGVGKIFKKVKKNLKNGYNFLDKYLFICYYILACVSMRMYLG